jgi:MSHA pilin protein MshC
MRAQRCERDSVDGGRGRPRDAGFTLVEIVVVLAVLAIVAAVAAPRFFSRTGFQERFYFEEVRSALGHARALAIASGCEVEVALASTGFTLRQRASCTTGAFSQAVANPATGATPYSAAPPAGVALSSTLDPVIFDALGRARSSGGVVTNVTVTVGTRQLGAIGETGLVYAP